MREIFRTLFAATLMTAALGIGIATPAAAQEEEGAIKHRQWIMRAVGGHMGAMGSIIKGEVRFVDDLKGHARAMVELSKIVERVFPEGSDFGETRALESIWEKPKEFKQAITAFQTEAAKLAKIAEGSDGQAFVAQFKNLGKACGGCHKKFREKKN